MLFFVYFLPVIQILFKIRKLFFDSLFQFPCKSIFFSAGSNQIAKKSIYQIQLRIFKFQFHAKSIIQPVLSALFYQQIHCRHTVQTVLQRNTVHGRCIMLVIVIESLLHPLKMRAVQQPERGHAVVLIKNIFRKP